MANNEIRQSRIRLSTVATTTRQTPRTDFGRALHNGLARVGNVVVDGLKVAAPLLPAGSIISAAIAGANTATGVAGSLGGSAGASYGSSVSGLGSAGAGPAAGSGVIGLPGPGPGLNTALGQSPSNFSGGANAGVQGSAASGASDSFNGMMQATRQMAEFQSSFNLQYLQLQQTIQQDTRQFTLISNIMKTKHDAAKNSMNNVR